MGAPKTQLSRWIIFSCSIKKIKTNTEKSWCTKYQTRARMRVGMREARHGAHPAVARSLPSLSCLPAHPRGKERLIVLKAISQGAWFLFGSWRPAGCCLPTGVLGTKHFPCKLYFPVFPFIPGSILQMRKMKGKISCPRSHNAWTDLWARVFVLFGFQSMNSCIIDID